MAHNKKTLPALLILSIFSSQLITAHSFFDDEDLFELPTRMVQEMERMHNQMRASTKRMSFHTQPGVSVSINENEQKNVVITIKGINTDTLEATLNETNNELTLETPNDTIHIRTKDTMLSVQATHEIKEKNKDTNNKQVFYGASTSQTSRNLTQPVDLEKQTIEYDKENERITISLPYKVIKNPGKLVPVKIVNKKSE